MGAFLALSTSALAQKPQAPGPGQGEITGSGKFVPAVPAASTAPAPANWQEAAAAAVEKTGETTFRVGKVMCDRKTQTLTIPVKVNAREGLIEYALVTSTGKVHEALLSTEASPTHVQIAAILLGISPAKSGDAAIPVSIDLEWETNGPRRSVALGELMSPAKGGPETKSGSSLGLGTWSFQGSILDAQGFAAEREGSLIALIGDASALIGNPKADNDLQYYPHTPELPPSGLPLSLRIRPKSPVR